MRKRIAFTMATVCVLLITECGNSSSAENPAVADSQIVENTEQTDTGEKAASWNGGGIEVSLLVCFYGKRR